MSDSIKRKTLLRWTAWFALANAVVFGLVSLRYFGGGVPADTPLAWIYLVSVYIGHHVLITVVPLLLLAVPLIVVLPRRRVLTAVAVVLFRRDDRADDAGQPAVVAKPVPHQRADPEDPGLAELGVHGGHLRDRAVFRNPAGEERVELGAGAEAAARLADRQLLRADDPAVAGHPCLGRRRLLRAGDRPRPDPARLQGRDGQVHPGQLGPGGCEGKPRASTWPAGCRRTSKVAPADCCAIR